MPQNRTSIMSLTLTRKLFVRGFILANTGLSIGGNDTGLGTGGASRVVVRHPVTMKPYVPGSTLKGRLRSLMERLAGEFGSTPGMPHTAIRKPTTEFGARVARLFGVPNDDHTPIPTRLTVRDAHLLNGEFLEANGQLDLPYTEIKNEVAIDRITARVSNHYYERVPAGAVFALDVVLTAYTLDKQDDDLAQIAGDLFLAMRLLQDDSLGAAGSRGYGRVAFHIEPLTTLTREDYIEGKPAHEDSDIAVPAELKLSGEIVNSIQSQINAVTTA